MKWSNEKNRWHINFFSFLSKIQVFTSIFTFECIIKLMALSKDFFLCGWNIFDLIIVSASLVDIIFELVDGLSVLRGLRLLRVIKLARSWTTMKVLLKILEQTIGECGPDEWRKFCKLNWVMVMIDKLFNFPFYLRCSWKFNINFSYCYLYFRCYWYAIVFERLYTRQILSGSSA